MSTIIVACNTLADEVNLALKSTGTTHPVYWIDSKLHIRPEQLKEQIQAAIDRISNVTTIILAFGFCGNGLAGIRSETARLILPRADDCISLLLGSQELRNLLSKEAPRYFFTRGWIESEHNLAGELEYCVRKFGYKRGLRIMRIMLKHYRRLTLIDTRAYDIALYKTRIDRLAEELGLESEVVKGSQRFFEKLLLGPWDEEFIVAGPGEPISFTGFSVSPQLGQFTEETKP